MIKERFLRLPIIVKLLQLTALGYGTCPVCGMPKKYCEGHDIMVDDYSGVAPICEHCWQTKDYQTLLNGFSEFLNEAYNIHWPNTRGEYLQAFKNEYKKRIKNE